MLRFAQLKQSLRRLGLLVMTDTPKEVVGLVHRPRVLAGTRPPANQRRCLLCNGPVYWAVAMNARNGSATADHMLTAMVCSQPSPLNS